MRNMETSIILIQRNYGTVFFPLFWQYLHIPRCLAKNDKSKHQMDTNLPLEINGKHLVERGVSFKCVKDLKKIGKVAF